MTKLCRYFFAAILFFCCIFVCTGTDVRASLEHRRDARDWKETCAEDEDGDAGTEFRPSFRYVRLYIKEEAYVVVDLAVVIGALALLLFFFMLKEY